VALLARKSEEDRKLAAARSDLDAAQRKLSTLLGRENAAATSADRWGQWTAERDVAAAEVARLTALVGQLEADAEAARAHDDAEALQKRVAAARKHNEALAERIRAEGNRLLIELKTLMRDVAKSTLETIALNESLPESEPKVPIADFLARDTAVFPRVDLKTEDVELWSRADNGALIGNQDQVTAIDDQTGYIDANNFRIKCVQRRYRSTTYHPKEALDHPSHLFSQVRLPKFDGPGVSFDGAFMTIEAVAALDVEPPMPVTKQRRSVQTELVAIDQWPAVGVAAEADKNSAL
jgi:hypothetical protein